MSGSKPAAAASSAHASNTFGNHRSVAVAAIQRPSTIIVRMHGFIHVLQPIRPSRAAQHLAEVASLENLKVAVERRSLMSDDGSIEWDSRTVTFPEGNHRTLGGLSNHRSVAVAEIQSPSTIMVRMHGFIHVLQRRNETHERMFLRTCRQ